MSNLLTTAAAALVGGSLLHLLRVPAGGLLGAMLAVGLLNVVGTEALAAATLPPPLRFASFVALGWFVGQGFTRETVATLRRSLLPILVVVVALLVFGAALGWVLIRLGVLDPATAYLATSPGALSQMSAVAATVGADATLVVTVHTVRVIVLIIAAPLIGRLAESAVTT